MDFIKENWTEILSVVGAAAWLPIVFKPIIRGVINYFRKVNAATLDSRVLTNATSESVGRKEKIKGTILLLTVNLFVKEITLFARKLSVKVTLKNGTVSNCEMLDFSTLTSNNDDGTESTFDVPVKDEFNISRTIHPNVDNIKFVAVLVKSATFSNIDEISDIEIRLYYRNIKCDLFSKTITLKPSDFPTFNSSHLIDAVERIHVKKGEKH